MFSLQVIIFERQELVWVCRGGNRTTLIEFEMILLKKKKDLEKLPTDSLVTLVPN